MLENKVLCSKKGFLLNVEGKEKNLNPESFYRLHESIKAIVKYSLE